MQEKKKKPQKQQNQNTVLFICEKMLKLCSYQIITHVQVVNDYKISDQLIFVFFSLIYYNVFTNDFYF